VSGLNFVLSSLLGGNVFSFSFPPSDDFQLGRKAIVGHTHHLVYIPVYYSYFISCRSVFSLFTSCGGLSYSTYTIFHLSRLWTQVTWDFAGERVQKQEILGWLIQVDCVLFLLAGI